MKPLNRPENSAFRNPYLRLLPILLAMAVLPLIVRIKIYDNHLSGYYWSSMNSEDSDAFLYYKGLFLILLGILAFIGIFRIIWKQKGIERGYVKYITLLGFFLSLMLVSALCSSYPYFAAHGVGEHFESIGIWVSYLFLCIFTLLVIRQKEEISLLFNSILLSAGILVPIGLLQFFRLDPYQFPLMKALIAPEAYRDSINFTFPDGWVYLSLYNPNYVGMYLALVLPILLFALWKSNKRWKKVILFCLAAGAVFCLVGSKAKNGVIALGVEFLLFMCGMLIRLFKKKDRKIILAVLAGGMAVILAAAIITGVPQALYQSFQAGAVSDKPLQKIETKQNSVDITYKDRTLSLTMEILEGGFIDFTMKDEKGRKVAYQVENANSEESYLTPEETPWNEFTLYPCTLPDQKVGFAVEIDGISWPFTDQVDDKGYYYMNLNQKYTKLTQAEAVGWIPDQAFSGRGGVWKRTLPMLKDRLLLGTGVESFVFEYPHNDYVAQYQNNTWGTAFTRPHNLYLQIAIEDGVLALLLFLAFYLFYLVDFVRLFWKYRKEKVSWLSGAQAAIFLSVTGYMVSGLINDSMPVTAPFFWILIGAGIAVNHRLKQTRPA